ncbi:nucleotidyltransferase family protein [bacterium]|nr:nucleotidyltransferase family protein [bacterium]
MNFSVIILAAGSSQRFQENKLLLSFAGSTILHHVIEKFIQLSPSEIIVVTGKYDEPIREALKNWPCKLIYNPDHVLGMSTSVRQGFSAISKHSDAAFITPGDLPLFRADTLDLIVQNFSDNIVIPVYNDQKGHPVLVNRSLIEWCLSHDEDKLLYKAIEFFTRNVKKIAVTDPGVVWDIDSREDYEKLKTNSSQ